MTLKYLTADFCSFYNWCKLNLLELNIKKCNHMAVLDKVKTILDLGVLLDYRHNFQDNVSMIVNKAFGILGYMKRWSKEFVDPYPTKIFFISIVWPILENCFIILFYYAVHTKRIGSVQFLIFCLRGLGWNSYEISE